MSKKSPRGSRIDRGGPSPSASPAFSSTSSSPFITACSFQDLSSIPPMEDDIIGDASNFLGEGAASQVELSFNIYIFKGVLYTYTLLPIGCSKV